MVKQNAEEYTSQCLIHENETKTIGQKLKGLPESNEILEKK